MIGTPGEAKGQEPEVALVDVRTDATASVLSPNVWIRRPRKSPTPMRSPDGTPLYDENCGQRTPSRQRRGKRGDDGGVVTPTGTGGGKGCRPVRGRRS